MRETTATCGSCGGKHRVRFEGGQIVADPCERAIGPMIPITSHAAAPGPTMREIMTRVGRAAARTTVETLRSSTALAEVRAGPRTRGRQAKPEADGRKFDSLGERDLYLALKARADVAAIWDHVAYPLPTVSSETRMRRFTVDFVVRLKDGRLEAHEFKGPTAIESRDFILRWGAFRATYPHLKATIWRKENGALVRASNR